MSQQTSKCMALIVKPTNLHPHILSLFSKFRNEYWSEKLATCYKKNTSFGSAAINCELNFALRN